MEEKLSPRKPYNQLFLVGLITFTLLFSLNFVAAWDFDNVKDYNATTKTVTITNALGLGEKIADIPLKSKPSEQLGLGYQKVFEYEIDSKTIYENFIQETEVYDLKDKGKKVNKKIDLKYLTYKDVEVDDYKEICKENENKTQTCNWEIVGKKTVSKEVWVDLKSLDVKVEKLTISGWTDVRQGDYYEWIPNFAGIKVEEWATWSGNLSTNLIAYWDMQNTTILDITGNGFSATNTGSTATTGKISNALDFENAESDYATVTDNPALDPTAFSVSLWFKKESNIDNMGLFSKGTSGTDILQLAEASAPTGEALRFHLATATGGYDSVDSSNLATGQWYHVVFKWDGEEKTIWINGVLNVTDTTGSGNYVGSTSNLWFGKDISTTYFDGIIDEIGYWSRNLSKEEISYLYNSNNGCTYNNETCFGISGTISVTLNSPVNTYNSTIRSILFNCTSVSSAALDNITLYLNNSVNQTNSSVFNNTATTFNVSIVDGYYSWNCGSCNEDSVCANGTTRYFTIDTTPLVNFTGITPLNNTNTTQRYIQGAVTYTGTYADLITIRLFNGTKTQIKIITDYAIDNPYPFQFGSGITPLSDGVYYYNATVTTTTGKSNTTERMITVDGTSPTINVTSPTGTFSLLNNNDSLNLNWTVSDSHLSSCWYNYNLTNKTVTCSANTTTFNYVFGRNNITLYANDTFGNIGSFQTNWTYLISEANQTYVSPVIEGSSQDFYVSLSVNPLYSVKSAVLNYNGLSVTGTTVAVSYGSLISKMAQTIPAVNTTSNITFYWTITLSDDTQINLSSKNQTVTNIGLDNCSSYNHSLANFNLVDEEFQTLISTNVDIEYSFLVYSLDRTTLIVNLSSNTTASSFGICLSQDLDIGLNYSLDGVIKYTAENYSIEYYNLLDYDVTNSTYTNITLYDLYLPDSTEFQLTFNGEDYLPVANALVYVDRQYVAENVFKTVELPLTDSNGQTVLHLVKNDIVYNIRIIKDGVLLGDYNGILAFCEDYTIGNCKLTLSANLGTSPLVNYDETIGIIYSNAPLFNDTTNIVTFTYTSTSGDSKTVLMTVERNDVFGNVSICNDTVISSSGTLSCTVPSGIDDTSLITTIYIDGVAWLTGAVIIDSSGYGVFGYLIWFVLSLCLFLMFSENKTLVVLALSISYISAVALGIIVGGIIGIGSAGIWIVVISAIGVWKLNRRKN